MNCARSRAAIELHRKDAQVRVVEIDGKSWFVAKDIPELLSYSDVRKAVELPCKEGMKRPSLPRNSRQTVTIIPERDVYRLLLPSRDGTERDVRATARRLEVILIRGD